MVYIGTCFDDIKNQNKTGVDCSVCPPCSRCSLTILPIRFDWRDYGVLPPVRDRHRVNLVGRFLQLVLLKEHTI